MGNGVVSKKASLIPSPGFLQEGGIVMWPWDFWKAWKIKGGIQNLKRAREWGERFLPWELVMVGDWGLKCSCCKIRFVNPWTVLWVSHSLLSEKEYFPCVCMHAWARAVLHVCAYIGPRYGGCDRVCVYVCVYVPACALLLIFMGQEIATGKGQCVTG